MGYTCKKMYGSNCHIFEFSQSELRFDATIGTPGKLEKLSKIVGEPKPDETTYAKLNGAFFNMNGSAEYIGTFVDDGLYYNPSEYLYPTFIFWKNGKCTIENEPNQARLAYYQGNANFAIGCPWTLIIDGKINYTYPMATLQKVFGHATAKAPRTLVGQKANGNIVWVAVDGRRIGSPGVNAATSAKIMQDLGCYVAVNVDGGGSTEMIIDGKIKNKPSDGCERSIGTAFVAYKKIPKITITEGPIKNGATAITTAAVNFRTGPSTSYSCIATLVRSSKVMINGYVNGWYNVTWNGKTGYISGTYLTEFNLTPTPTPDSKPVATFKARVTASIGLTVRKGPGTSNSRVRAIPYNTVITVYETKDNWYRIGTNEWVCATYTKKI